MLQFNAGVEPLPSRMIFWSDTFLEHEKANHSDIIRNHPFNYRMEIVLNFYNHNDSTTEASYGLVAYDEEQSLENNNKPSRHLPEVNSKELIQNILNLCTDLKDKSVVYLCSNIQPVDIISYVQERVLTREESSSDYLVYCHTLGAHTDCLSANQMAIYPIFKTSSSSTHGINVATPLEREHHLRFRLDQDTLLEIGLQRNEKNKIHSKKTSAHSANFESDNYSTVGYKMPFKPKSKEYERLMWSLNKEGTCPMHCFFGVFSIEKNCWIEMSDFESFVQSRINSNTTNSEETFGASSAAENKVLIKKTPGKDIFNVRILKEESLVLPRVELSIETIAKGGEKSEQNKHPSTACNTLEGFSQLQQLGHHAPPSNLMDETSDNEDDHEEGEHDEDDNDENDEHDEVSHHLFSMFNKSLSPSEEKEICKQETAKAILTSVGLLSGGMGSECLSASDDSKSSEVTTSSSTTHQEDASFVNIVAQRNHLLFMNALMHDVKFARVDQTFIIKLDGILPPLFVEKIFELVWKGTRVGKCWNAFLVTGMEDAVVSWKKFNHTYSVSGENDYLYVIFPTTYSSTKQQEITPNWLIQILNQQDEFS
ncbi:hypothetical protein C9374_012172 [Naegleria lovaniensis]|uniref:Uncharacterized protein n=1 Tax=Naegleria lovaniensis TaxID=51637 RepID=A0AA88GDI8_NAELO|nr:uncharacterized protein C9374_012172 [Naegleria lovaniensis]KAG2373433.1 hypothetical protein C9374_012172 [Naegleria lovaniensis]